MRAADELGYPMLEMPDHREVPQPSSQATEREFSLLITMTDIIIHEEGVE